MTESPVGFSALKINMSPIWPRAILVNHLLRSIVSKVGGQLHTVQIMVGSQGLIHAHYAELLGHCGRGITDSAQQVDLRHRRHQFRICRSAVIPRCRIDDLRHC